MHAGFRFTRKRKQRAKLFLLLHFPLYLLRVCNFRLFIRIHDQEPVFAVQNGLMAVPLIANCNGRNRRQIHGSRQDCRMGALRPEMGHNPENPRMIQLHRLPGRQILRHQYDRLRKRHFAGVPEKHVRQTLRYLGDIIASRPEIRVLHLR